MVLISFSRVDGPHNSNYFSVLLYGVLDVPVSTLITGFCDVSTM